MVSEYTCSFHKSVERKFLTCFLSISGYFQTHSVCCMVWCNPLICWLSQTCLGVSSVLVYYVLFLPSEHVSTSVNSLSTFRSESVTVWITVGLHCLITCLSPSQHCSNCSTHMQHTLYHLSYRKLVQHTKHLPLIFMLAEIFFKDVLPKCEKYRAFNLTCQFSV